MNKILDSYWPSNNFISTTGSVKARPNIKYYNTQHTDNFNKLLNITKTSTNNIKIEYLSDNDEYSVVYSIKSDDFLVYNGLKYNIHSDYAKIYSIIHNNKINDVLDNL